MARRPLSPEQKAIIHAKLVALEQRLGTQKAVAVALDFTQQTISAALLDPGAIGHGLAQAVLAYETGGASGPIRLVPDKPDAMRNDRVVLRPASTAEPASRVGPEPAQLPQAATRSAPSDVTRLDRLIGRAFQELGEDADVMSSDNSKLFEAIKAAAAEIATYTAADAGEVLALLAATSIELRHEGIAVNAPVLAVRAARTLLHRLAANDGERPPTGTHRRTDAEGPGEAVPDEGEIEAGIRAAKGHGQKKRAK